MWICQRRTYQACRSRGTEQKDTRREGSWDSSEKYNHIQSSEKKTDNARERREHDETFVKDLLDEIFNMELHDGEMEKMYRLGHWTDGKDRPLLVGFKNYEQKEQIMTNLRKFKES